MGKHWQVHVGEFFPNRDFNLKNLMTEVAESHHEKTKEDQFNLDLPLGVHSASLWVAVMQMLRTGKEELPPGALSKQDPLFWQNSQLPLPSKESWGYCLWFCCFRIHFSGT